MQAVLSLWSLTACIDLEWVLVRPTGLVKPDGPDAKIKFLAAEDTSGIIGSETRTQKDKDIADTIDIFTNDTLKGGAKKPEVVKVLCGNSGADVDWLVEKFGLDLSLLARLGGHSMPRTHRG